MNTSLEHIMYHAGLSSVRSAKKSPKLKEVLTALHEFEEEGYISLPDKPLDEMGFSELFTIEVLYGGIPVDGYKPDGTFKLEGRFVMIEFRQYKRIIIENHSRSNPENLYVFICIRSHIHTRGKSQTIEDKPESWHMSYEQIAAETGISEKTIGVIIGRLSDDMGLIRCSKPANITRGRRDGKVLVTGNNNFNLQTVFVLDKDGWEEELAWGKKIYRRSSYNKYAEMKQ